MVGTVGEAVDRDACWGGGHGCETAFWHCGDCCFCWMEEAYDGGGGGLTGAVDVADGAVGAIAVCSMGFCTCVLFTDCMMIGGCVFACLALQPGSGAGLVTEELQLETFDVGLGEPADAEPEYMPDDGDFL